jgi:flavin reductase (DIM6/NTAB) family NADH-FMN oxidoreductase RutF
MECKSLFVINLLIKNNMILNLNDILQLEKFYRRSLLNQLSGIRSANMIGTRSVSGVSNLAIFNSATHIGATPPYLGFLFRPLTVERHTYENIKTNNYFTVNQVTEAIHRQAHQTSAKFPAGSSEFAGTGLTEAYISSFPAPFVAESPVKIGLSYQEEHRIKANNTVFLIGKVEKIILPDDAVDEGGNIDLELLNTVGVGGLDTYYRCEKIGRYAYARVGQEVREEN